MTEQAKKINQLTHPDYDAMQGSWAKFRAVFDGGSAFVKQYLQKFSVRENQMDFENRRKISYCPGHAKAAVTDIKNAIYQRMIDITRKTNIKSYNEAVLGQNRGVDLTGNTMNGFIGRVILAELLSMGKVGIFVDKHRIVERETLLVAKDKRPYLYYYQAEKIRSWTYDDNNELSVVLLEDTIQQAETNYGLTTDEITKYRLLTRTPVGVVVEFFDSKGDALPEESVVLPLTKIPFVIFEISSSLLTDVADYQVALLNLASSDLNYAFKSNFPFYVEQFIPQMDLLQNRTAQPGNAEGLPGTSTEGNAAKTHEVHTGTTQGRRYAKGLEKPDFIHPSAEPLRASMDKQKQLREEIRLLVNLALSNIEPRRASAESKSMDQQGLEAGLSYIGLECEYGERQIAEIWADYEGASNAEITIKYPQKYSLRSDADRRAEAEEDTKLLPILPSVTYQKVMAKKIVALTIGPEISNEELEQINKEIDDAPVILTDPEVIAKDLEAGLVGEETASKLRGYPAGEVEKARKDHADRAARVSLAQSEAGARGVADLDVNQQGGKPEKDQKEIEEQ